MSDPCPHCEENKHRDAGYICTCQDKVDHPKWSRTVYAKRIWQWNGAQDNRGVVDSSYYSQWGEDSCRDCEKSLVEHGHIRPEFDEYDKVCPGDRIIEYPDGTFEVVSAKKYKKMNWKERE